MGSSVACLQGLDRAVAPRFSEWTFNVHTVEISANEYLENQTEALRELLAQLQTFQVRLAARQDGLAVGRHRVCTATAIPGSGKHAVSM